MSVFIEEDWIINKDNVFGLEKKEMLALDAIQRYILESAKSWDKTNSVERFLGFAINVETKILDDLTVEAFLKGILQSDYKSYQNKDIKFRFDFVRRFYVYVTLWFYEYYVSETLPAILKVKAYKEIYSDKLNSFLSFRADTDEGDFIKAELSKCNEIIDELKKPVYNLFDEHLPETPYFFATAATYSIEKRQSFLNLRQLSLNENYNSVVKNEVAESVDGSYIKRGESKTKAFIIESFENIDKKKWQYAFDDENDLNLFSDLLTNFFEYKNYIIPKKVIHIKRMTRTKVASVLGEIYRELSEKQLKADYDFFKIVRVLNHFQNDSDEILYKALTR